MPEFDEIEKQIIRNAMISKSNREIALLINADTNRVAAFVSTLTNVGVITHQMKLDEGKALVKERPAKVKRLQVPSEAKRRQEETKKLNREIKEQKNSVEKNLASNRRQRREPKFKTKVVDYSQMKTVRIDSKTLIYIKQEADEEAARIQYLKNHKKS